jgi:hypothetical protein
MGAQFNSLVNGGIIDILVSHYVGVVAQSRYKAAGFRVACGDTQFGFLFRI